MANGIGRAHKPGNKNMQWHVFANGPFKTTPLTPNFNETTNDRIIVLDQELITTKTYSSPSKGNELEKNLKNGINLQLCSLPRKCPNSIENFHDSYNDQFHISEVDPWTWPPISADIGTSVVPLST